MGYVIFKEIKVVGDYIYAVAYKGNTGKVVKIKVHKSIEEYYIEGGFDVEIIKALWALQKGVKKGKVKNNVLEVYWG